MKLKTTVHFSGTETEIEVPSQEAEISANGNIIKKRLDLRPCLTMAMMSGKISYDQYKDCHEATVTLYHGNARRVFTFNKRHRGKK